MPDNRCCLHKTKLEAFKDWLSDNGLAHRPGKGEWQALQVQTPTAGWQVVFLRATMPEHFSVNEKLMPLVRQFIADQRALRATQPPAPPTTSP